MANNFNEEWLDWAVRLEDEAACDVEAGLNLGMHLVEYLADSRDFISHEKLMTILQEELGAFLSHDDLEIIAGATQGCARDRIKDKFLFSKTA